MNAGWRVARVGEICTFNYGKALPESARKGGATPVFGSNGVVGFHDSPITSGKTIVIGRKGSFGEVHYSEVPSWPIDTAYFVDEASTEQDIRWLFFQLGCLGLNKMNKAAAVPGLNREDAYRQELLLPPLPEQRRIAAILDKADALRTKRREALAQFDRLAQSIFVEMFGDPEVNELRLPVAELQDLCSRVTDGTHQSPTWEQSGIPFLFISNIVDGKVMFDTDKFISRETYEELTRRCRIEVGDVLYTTVGSYGNTAIVDGQREFCFQRHIAHVKPNPALLDSVFCAVMLESTGVRRQVDRCARGVAQKTVNLSDLKTLRVFAPPIEVQREFRRKAEAARQIKDLHLQAKKHDEALFVSLQDRAFRGGL